MLMNMQSTKTTPELVHEVFRSLLKSYNTSNLISPPEKNTIRFIENDENNHREKYDGRRWRLACTWHGYECPNLAYSWKLCPKHNAQRRNKIIPPKKKKRLVAFASLPIMHHKTMNEDDDDEDIQIIGEFNNNETTRHPMNSTVKSESSHFNQFSIDLLHENESLCEMKSEPRASSSHYSESPIDVEYVGSKIRTNGLNITELTSKNIPPLTEFEEEYIGTLLIEKLPTTCSMLDAQLYLHEEAMNVVKRNYRLKMDAITPEYFYDFLLRHPRVAIHYKNWFLRCKLILPATGSPIDTKVWTLSMMVRGTMTSDEMDEE